MFDWLKKVLDSRKYECLEKVYDRLKNGSDYTDVDGTIFDKSYKRFKITVMDIQEFRHSSENQKTSMKARVICGDGCQETADMFYEGIDFNVKSTYVLDALAKIVPYDFFSKLNLPLDIKYILGLDVRETNGIRKSKKKRKKNLNKSRDNNLLSAETRD